MAKYQGDYAEDSVVIVYFDTFSATGSSTGSIGFALADLFIYKDDDLAQRVTNDGITIAANFDGRTGLNMIRLDTNNNTGDAGFWVAQADYMVFVNSLTIGGEVVRFVAGTFSIENRVTDVYRFRGGAIPTPAVTGVPDVNPTHWADGAIPTQNVTGVPEVDITHQVGGLVPTPTTTGVPDVNVERWLDTLVTLSAGAPDVNIQSTDDIGLSTTQKADVNTEVLDVMDVDTFTELSQGVPSATPTHRAALMLIYMALRNRLDVDTAGGTDHKEIYNDANVVITKKVLTDDGSTYREDKMITGP